MTRWLGDGGMPLLEAIGVHFDAFGAGEAAQGTVPAGTPTWGPGDEPPGGWAAATWSPTTLACNPRGVVQAGVHAVVLDAAMNFALNAGLQAGDRSRATLEIKTETMRPGQQGEGLVVGARIVRLTRQVAWTEGLVCNPGGQPVSRATATFLVHREQ